ncbi:response regulator [Vibrio renipiscarius]|uniref:Chemotaxis protein CheY n=1 Tax=Vibrio renipiscarius TaxID=1461322 RepID=A0A0C2JH17_9VIBR|nr:response regulator [Vibrio renipiscarius]KII77134.1 chemotaxis protein CheY [Vibrio renipiscarius]KII77264.1 chemotaxis protein CheY [Vibrio renipiscarius]
MHKVSEAKVLPSGHALAKKKRVMLVDDDPIFRRITASILVAQGYEVLEAEDGLAGLKHLREFEPDLVLCDLAMPVLNGIEFVEEVSLEYPSLPVIVVSATEEMSDVARALRFGIKDFLPKPISDPTNLTDAIENTLEDSDSHIGDNRDFASQWFRVDSGDMPDEQELHWHLDYLENNPSSAKDLLHALLPEKETAQGDWKCSYRLLQSTDVMPLVFDYAWLMKGQFIFYLVDSDNVYGHGAATTLLVRALFHDYLRNLKSFNANLKDLAELLEKGINCADCATPIRALFGVADVAEGTISLLPAGIESRYRSGELVKHIPAGVRLGEKCMKNFTTTDLYIDQHCVVSLNRLGASSFALDLSKKS